MGSPKMSLRIKGDKDLIRTLNAIKRQSPVALGAALYQEGEEIMADSKENYVPVDTTDLKVSGHVELPDIAKDHVTVMMGYGGAAEEYAVAVHEHLSWHSPRSWIIAEQSDDVHFTVGGPKYLEIPLNNASKGMGVRLAAKANAFLRKFGK